VRSVIFRNKKFRDSLSPIRIIVRRAFAWASFSQPSRRNSAIKLMKTYR
jgi:hypothetical protein